MMKRVLFVLIFVVIVAAAATGYYWKVVLHPSLNSARLVGTWEATDKAAQLAEQAGVAVAAK